jgi:N-acetylneuraminic acid mutarotase
VSDGIRREKSMNKYNYFIFLSFVFLVLPIARVSASSTWSPTGSMVVARSRHTATRLPDGRVLVVGGITGSPTNIATTPTAEIYDPAVGIWSQTGSLITPRSRHAAVLLGNGKVLVAGGRDNGLATATAELFDFSTGSWSLTGSLNVPRDFHTATLLADGRVLVAGGISGGDGRDNPLEKTAEIYDPVTGAWSLVDHMAQARYGHTATRMADGTVLIAGGTGPRGDGVYTVRAEIYDPQSGVWRNVDSMATPRGFHTAALLADGSVLVAGGLTSPANDRNVTAAAELFQPGTGRWISAGNMSVARGAGPYGATLLLDGRFLLAGGRTNTAELYDPGVGAWSLTGSMAVSRSSHTVTLLSNGSVLVAGGENFSGFISTAEVYVP